MADFQWKTETNGGEGPKFALRGQPLKTSLLFSHHAILFFFLFQTI